MVSGPQTSEEGFIHLWVQGRVVRRKKRDRSEREARQKKRKRRERKIEKQ